MQTFLTGVMVHQYGGVHIFSLLQPATAVDGPGGVLASRSPHPGLGFREHQRPGLGQALLPKDGGVCLAFVRGVSSFREPLAEREGELVKAAYSGAAVSLEFVVSFAVQRVSSWMKKTAVAENSGGETKVCDSKA